MRYDDFILPKSDETIPVHDEPAAVHETLHEAQKPVRHFVSLPDLYMESFEVLGTVYALHIRRRGVGDGFVASIWLNKEEVSTIATTFGKERTKRMAIKAMRALCGHRNKRRREHERRMEDISNRK